MKIIIAPDKFKGSLTSAEACNAIAAGITEAYPSAAILQYPMADGGDGFEAVLKGYLKTTSITCSTQDPIGRPITAGYEFDEHSHTAIIGLAAASGLVLLKESEKDALNASSYGTGILINDAIRRGVKRIHLGLGGSASTDAGTGILSALGFQFLDSHGRPLKPCGASLVLIQRIIPPAALPDIIVEIAADVQNPLYGPRGAAHVYARQKGASDEDIQTLDNGLQHFAGILQNLAGRDIAHIPGVGAAGGIAAGLIPFFQTNIHSGIDKIIQASGITASIPGASLLITGEGKIDNQSADGKVIGSLAALANQSHVPVIAFCGITDGSVNAASLGLQAIYPITPPGMPIAEAMAKAYPLLQAQATAVFAKFNL